MSLLSDKGITNSKLSIIFQELMRIIDHDRKLKEFMTVKCEDRAELLGFSIQHALRREERERNNEKDDIIQVKTLFLFIHT